MHIGERVGGHDLHFGDEGDFPLAAVGIKLHLRGVAAVVHPQGKTHAGLPGLQRRQVVARRGHDLVQELDAARLAVVDIMHNDLVAAGLKVQPARCGKLAGIVFHLAAAAVVHGFVGIGDDQVRRHMDGAARAPVGRQPPAQKQQLQRQQHRQPPVFAGPQFFQLSHRTASSFQLAQLGHSSYPPRVCSQYSPMLAPGRPVASSAR